MTPEERPIDLDGLELELRRLAGVVAVAIDAQDGTTSIRVTADARSSPSLRPLALQVARAFCEGPLSVELLEASGDHDGRDSRVLSRTSARVRVIAVDLTPGDSEVSVHLGYGDGRSVGRSRSAPLIGAVRATLAALQGLGAELPFQIRAVSRLAAGPYAPVMVALRPTDGGAERLGIARSGSDVDSACRATLHALNRHLELAMATAQPV
ncbi:MAG TPA: hypothetical protein VFH45_13175 [Acidimicrobiales bacterium]|nr:hypothetical protein [Acidimicrobiales bacterium]